MTRVAILVVTAVLLSSSAHALCTLNLRSAGGDGVAPLRLEWDAVPGAEDYEIREWRERDTVISHTVDHSPFVIARRASKPTKATYEVAARLFAGVRVASSASSSVQDSCMERIEVTIPADEAFRAFTRRAIVPVAGSLPAAGGGNFRTSIEMVSVVPSHKGRMVFRAAGTAPAATDPSLSYALDLNTPRLYFEDVVAVMGGTGVGSIEIIPDADTDGILPATRVRTFHQDGNGARGSYDVPSMPFDYRGASSLTIYMPPATSRVNVGFRPLQAGTVKFLTFNAQGTLRAIRDVNLAADVTSLTSIDQMLGSKVSPGERVTMIVSPGVIPFYTFTDNASGDTEVFVTSPDRSRLDVGSYVE